MTDRARVSQIWCDESGYTGGDLLNRDQPLFTYAAHDLTADEAKDLVARIRSSRKRPIQAEELKAAGKTGLRKRDDWPEIAAMTLEALDGRLLVVVTDKRLALAGKIFEYVIEPVVADNSMLFYRHGLHRMVAAALHRTFERFDGPAEELAVELRTFMRSFDVADAPHVFGVEPELPEDAVVLKQLLRFARGYRDWIIKESEFLRAPDGLGKWVLDLTSTALWSLLPGGFGHRHARIAVTCDESGPVMASGGLLDTWIDSTKVVPLEGGSRKASLRLNLAKPVEFGRSIELPALQIADIAAGMAAEIFGPSEKNQLGELTRSMVRHLHPDFILPSKQDPLDPGDPLAQANLWVLRVLAGRAELRQDPLKGMPEIYEAALKRFSRPAARLNRAKRVAGVAKGLA